MQESQRDERILKTSEFLLNQLVAMERTKAPLDTDADTLARFTIANLAAITEVIHDTTRLQNQIIATIEKLNKTVASWSGANQ